MLLLLRDISDFTDLTNTNDSISVCIIHEVCEALRSKFLEKDELLV